MCGLAGWIGRASPDRFREVGDRFCRTLGHRGPDGRGVTLLDEGRGVFAHTRLKIIDPSERAAQPFSGGGCVLVFNGEIYNYREMRRRLRAQGHAFRSESDAEVVLRQYLHEGVRGLEGLDGMFAFAIWDGVQRRLVLMRDRFGQKPLYWLKDGPEEFLFASEPATIASKLPAGLKPNLDAIPELLFYGYVREPLTVYQKLRQLPPGSQLVQVGSEVTIRSYYSVARKRKQPSLGQAVDEVRTMVGHAVEKRLNADVPVGVFLSGGLDSSVVVAEMASRQAQVRSYSVGFDDAQDYDESRYATKVAELFGSKHTEIRVSVDDGAAIDAVARYTSGPTGDGSTVATLLLARAAKADVGVVLTGDGGDELFAGYSRFLAGMMPRTANRLISGVLRLTGPPQAARTGYKDPRSLLGRFGRYAERDRDEQYLAYNSFFAGGALGRLLRRDVFGERDPWDVVAGQAEILAESRRSGRDRLGQILDHNLQTYLLSDLLPKVDRMTMASGLEARCPFLDTALFDMIYPICTRTKFVGFRLKGLLKRAYRSVLPAYILNRPKHGFGVPLGRWWNGALRAYVDERLASSDALLRDFLEGAEIDEVLNAHRQGRVDNGQRIFLLLQIEIWLQNCRSQGVSTASNALVAV